MRIVSSVVMLLRSAGKYNRKPLAAESWACYDTNRIIRSMPRLRSCGPHLVLLVKFVNAIAKSILASFLFVRHAMTETQHGTGIYCSASGLDARVLWPDHLRNGDAMRCPSDHFQICRSYRLR